MLRLVTLFREKHLQVHLIPCSTALGEELGLGLSTLTGSKTVLNILNRFGHCISYDDVKRLETEMAYSCCEGDRETPAGLNLCDGLSTGNYIYISFACE